MDILGSRYSFQINLSMTFQQAHGFLPIFAGISVISMAKAPVNSLNLPMLTQLKEALVAVQEDNSDGLILTSALATVFSAGLDIMEMYKPQDSRVVQFWTALQDAWITLYGLGIPSVAAINVR